MSTSLTTRHGLPSELIHQILEDDLGNIWIGSDRGIHRVRKQQLFAVMEGRAARVELVAYDEQDGLTVLETNGHRCQPAGTKSRDGRLWFPTPKGAVIIDPRNLPDATNAPPVILEEVRANGRIVFSNGLRSGPELAQATKTSDSRETDYLLPPGSADTIELQFTACSFLGADKLRFKYRMHGLDRDWVESGTTRKAYYTGLRPGKYRFQVVAANKYGVWNETGATFAFVVRPFWFQSWWFRGGLLAALVSAAAWAIRRRIALVRERAGREAAAVLATERERLARDLHDGLGADLARLQRLAERAERELSNREALASVAREFAESARGTAQRFRDTLWTTHVKDQTIEGLAVHLMTEAESILRPAGVRCRFDLPQKLAGPGIASQPRRHLLLFTREALTNVARHAHASVAELGLKVEDHHLVLWVRDDGRGFVVPQMPGPNPAQPAKGLNNLQSRASAMSASLTIESAPGHGTTITLRVPIPPPE